MSGFSTKNVKVRLSKALNRLIPIAKNMFNNDTLKSEICEKGFDGNMGNVYQPCGCDKPEPPPAREFKTTLFSGLVETKESKQKTKKWSGELNSKNRLCRNYGCRCNYGAKCTSTGDACANHLGVD